MTTPGAPRGFSELERHSSELVEAMRLTARLLRALAPVATEMRALQDAMVTLQEATAVAAPAGPPPAVSGPAPARLSPPPSRQTHEYVPETRSAAAAPETPAEPAASAASLFQPGSARSEPPAWNQQARAEAQYEPSRTTPVTTDQSAAGSGQPAAPAVAEQPASKPDDHAHDRSVEEPVAASSSTAATPRPEPAQRQAPAEGRKRTVSVTVMRSEGPLDLVRVHGALDGLEGVSGLALASYTRGRANILLDTEREPTDLDVREALLAAFPEGVSGEWTGENEYVATIGAETPVTG